MTKTLTASDTLAHEQVLEDLPLIYEVITRNKSQWRPKKVQNKKSPDINIAGRINLSVSSKWNAGGRRGDVRIQYVPGAPTIFINDYVDVDGNVQPGLKKLGYDLEKRDYERAVKEGICFVNGILFLENYGGKDNRNLLEYVYYHALHEGAPNFKKTRNLTSMLTFRALVAEKKAAKPLENLETEVEAMNLFGSIRFVNPDGTFTYNVPKLNAILGIYDEGGGLGPEDYNQKLAALLPYFRKSPMAFLNEYKKHIQEYDAAIKMAQTFNVLTIASKEVKLKSGTSNTTIKTFSKEDKKTNIEDLIFHFMGNPQGQNDYNVLIAETEKAKITALK